MLCDSCSDRLRDELLTESTALGRNSTTATPCSGASCGYLPPATHLASELCHLPSPSLVSPSQDQAQPHLAAPMLSHTNLPLAASPNSSSLHSLWPLGNFYGFGGLARAPALPIVSFTCQSLGALHVELPSSRILGKDSCRPSCLFLDWFSRCRDCTGISGTLQWGEGSRTRQGEEANQDRAWLWLDPERVLNSELPPS